MSTCRISILAVEDNFNPFPSFEETREGFSVASPLDWMTEAWERGDIDPGTFVVVESHGDLSVRTAVCVVKEDETVPNACTITMGLPEPQVPLVTRWPPRNKAR